MVSGSLDLHLVAFNFTFSFQLQKSVVLLLHKILLCYQTNQSVEARRVLQRGALFLHNLSQVDGQFEERQYMVQHQYTELIFGLNALFKPAAYENESKCSILDLSPFNELFKQMS